MRSVIMRKSRIRISGALLLVLASLLAASLACYSGQVPGVFELTPYSTPTQIPKADDARYRVLETVLAPLEEGYTFFNMTLFPEPLEKNLLNSKALCEVNSSATVLYAGTGENGLTYYLIDCSGAVGWAAENRLAGPLKFQPQDLALTVSATGQPIQLLDQTTFQPMVSFVPCMPETVVVVQNVQTADTDADGAKELYYLIDCPSGNRGYVGGDDLFGPVKVEVGDQALAMAVSGNVVSLSSEPTPVTDDNRIGDCPNGAVMDVREAMLLDDVVYFDVQCGAIEGWTNQANLIGPLAFEAGDYAMLYVPSQFVFASDLPGEAADEVAVVSDGDAEPVSGASAAEGDGDDGADRKVVEYTPPAYLTAAPAPAVPGGENANVVGQCESNTSAHVLEYQGSEDSIYYRITCDLCTEADELGECLSAAPQEGWIEQSYLQGPFDFVPGDRVQFKSSAKAVIVDEETSVQYARIPATTTGAEVIGEYAVFSGRCLYDDGLEVTGVLLETVPPTNRIAFYFEVQCQGQPADITYETDEAGTTRPVISYRTDETGLVKGYALGRDLVAMDG